MTILFLYSEKELISRNKYSSASIPSYDLMILAGGQETFKTRLTKTHLPFHQRLRHTFSIKLRNRDRSIPQNLSDMMLCLFVSTRGCQELWIRQFCCFSTWKKNIEIKVAAKFSPFPDKEHRNAYFRWPLIILLYLTLQSARLFSPHSSWYSGQLQELLPALPSHWACLQ